MSAIDLILLGIIKETPKSAYDIQKEVEYRNISRCVKISTTSIYKKVIQLEAKGYIKSKIIKEGKMPEKALYSLTETGETYYHDLILKIASQPINIFLDFNAAIMNLDSLPLSEQLICLDKIHENIIALKTTIETNISSKPMIPETGKSVLKQQLSLAETLENWLNTQRECIGATHDGNKSNN